MSHPSHDEIKERIGHGVAVFVEGESQRDDPYFYGRWFGAESQVFAFFACGGCNAVISAVEQRRQDLPDVPIFGIVDRDYADEDEWQTFNDDFQQSHVLKMPKFTLENYLLDAECWHKTFMLVFGESPPDDWNSPEANAQQIQQAYMECLSLAAHNWVIKFGNAHYSEQAARTPERDRTYLETPEALATRDPAAKLADWGRAIGASEDFAELYRKRLQRLQAISLDELPKFVSGKHVLRSLHRRFPKRQIGLGVYLNLYLDRCPDPHDDLKELLRQIRVAAG
jgi:hypothetical protein